MGYSKGDWQLTLLLHDCDHTRNTDDLFFRGERHFIRATPRVFKSVVLDRQNKVESQDLKLG